MDDTIDVRPGEALDSERLESYLRANLPETAGAFSLRQFGGGHANLTYLARFGEREYVLRRPPHGPLPQGSHDMRREYRVLSVLYEHFPLAPRAYALCTDPDVVGADFVVMERRRGIVIRRTLPPPLDADPRARGRLADHFIDALAALHGVDFERAGLAMLGKPTGYLERQLHGWVERWNAAETSDRADAKALVAHLEDRLPHSGPPSLVHNDYKLDNTMLDAADATRLIAVLDWDMCTLGDPLADLGNVLALWMEPGDSPSASSSMMPTGVPGFPTRAEVVERYARATGRDCSRSAWYRAFNVFRYAVITQQIYARFTRGQTHDERFRSFGRLAAGLIASGSALADRGI